MIINTSIYRNLFLRILPLIKEMIYCCCCSITQSLFNNSNSLWPHGLQHTRLPCPSPSPGVCSDSCPLSQWCHPITSSSVTPFSSCPKSFPASGPFPMSQLFTSGGHSTGVSALALVLPLNIQGWFPLGLAGFSPCCPRDSQESFPAPQFESVNSNLDWRLVSYMILRLVHWDDPEGWYGEGGGFRMGNTCIPVADSCWYMAKAIQYCKVKK